MAAVFGVLGSAGVVYWHTMHRSSGDGPLFTSVSNAPGNRLTRLLDFLTRRDFIYFVLVLAVFGKANWFLLFAAPGAPIFFFLLVFAAARDRAVEQPQTTSA
jgi:protein-S-isoprenylcysteine O-methyltransferase Ste14